MSLAPPTKLLFAKLLSCEGISYVERLDRLRSSSSTDLDLLDLLAWGTSLHSALTSDPDRLNLFSWGCSSSHSTLHSDLSPSTSISFVKVRFLFRLMLELGVCPAGVLEVDSEGAGPIRDPLRGSVFNKNASRSLSLQLVGGVMGGVATRSCFMGVAACSGVSRSSLGCLLALGVHKASSSSAMPGGGESIPRFLFRDSLSAADEAAVGSMVVRASDGGGEDGRSCLTFEAAFLPRFFLPCFLVDAATGEVGGVPHTSGEESWTTSGEACLTDLMSIGLVTSSGSFGLSSFSDLLYTHVHGKRNPLPDCYISWNQGRIPLKGFTIPRGCLQKAVAYLGLCLKRGRKRDFGGKEGAKRM